MYAAYKFSSTEGLEISHDDKGGCNFTLSLEKSNVGQENEGILRNFLAKKLMKNSMFSDTGQISTISFPKVDGNELELGVYYIRLASEESSFSDLSHSQTETAEEDPSQENEKPDFILCFLDQDKSKLDLFHTELDSFSTGTLFKVFQENVNQLESVALDWQYFCVDYLLRSVALLGKQLEYFLSAAVQCHPMKFEGFSSDQKDDFNLLLEASRVLEQTPMNSETEGAVKPVTTVTLIDNTTVTIDHTKSSSGCSQLATNLLTFAETKQAVNIKQLLYNFRLKVSQDLNSLRRMIGQAETDFYALYRLFSFLKQTETKDILLDHLIGWELQEPEEREVVQSVREFMAQNEKRQPVLGGSVNAEFIHDN